MAKHWEIEIETAGHWDPYMNRTKTRAVRVRSRQEAESLAMTIEINHSKKTRLVHVER